MRAAPPVSVRATGGWIWRAVCTALPALAAGVLALWGLSLAQLNPIWALSALLLAGAVAGRLNKPVAATLTWDGQRWAVDDQPAELDVMLDLDRWMLLRLRPVSRGPVRWLALDAAQAGPAWHGLRVAAYGPLPQDPAAT